MIDDQTLGAINKCYDILSYTNPHQDPVSSVDACIGEVLEELKEIIDKEEEYKVSLRLADARLKNCVLIYHSDHWQYCKFEELVFFVDNYISSGSHAIKMKELPIATQNRLSQLLANESLDNWFEKVAYEAYLKDMIQIGKLTEVKNFEDWNKVQRK